MLVIKKIFFVTALFIVSSMINTSGGELFASSNLGLPVFTSSSTVKAYENQLLATTLVATDESVLTYSIVEHGSTNLQVDSKSGEVTFINTPDFETTPKYTFEAYVRDTQGNEVSQLVTIKIVDVDEINPVFLSSNTVRIYGNKTVVMTLVAADESPLTYSIQKDEEIEFEVDSDSGEVSFINIPDYEEENSYTFKAYVTDDEGNQASQIVTITLLDQNKNVGAVIAKDDTTSTYTYSTQEENSSDL